MTIYTDFGKEMVNIGKDAFDYSVALFKSKFYEPHSDIFHDFLSNLPNALETKHPQYCTDHKIQFYEQDDSWFEGADTIQPVPLLVVQAKGMRRMI